MYGQTIRGNSPFWYEYGQSGRRSVVSGEIRTAMPFRGGGASSKIRCCCCGGSDAYNGTTFTSPTLSPAFATSLRILVQASSISSSPVRKIKMSPGGSHAWICTAVRIAAEINKRRCQYCMGTQSLDLGNARRTFQVIPLRVLGVEDLHGEQSSGDAH
jgi:hypothetical protein